jgi:hypothetical protein
MPSEQLPEKISPKLKAFRDEIAGYIRDYKSGKIQGTMYDLSLITNIEDLTEEDLIMWERVENYKTNPIPTELLDYYQKQVKDSKNSSRDNFRAYIIQKITWLSSLNINTKEQ